jgi:hypothetical protein
MPVTGGWKWTREAEDSAPRMLKRKVIEDIRDFL